MKKPEILKIKLPALFKAGDERIELPPKVLETPIIPFDQSPICASNKNYYTMKKSVCQDGDGGI